MASCLRFLASHAEATSFAGAFIALLLFILPLASGEAIADDAHEDTTALRYTIFAVHIVGCLALFVTCCSTCARLAAAQGCIDNPRGVFTAHAACDYAYTAVAFGCGLVAAIFEGNAGCGSCVASMVCALVCLVPAAVYMRVAAQRRRAGSHEAPLLPRHRRRSGDDSYGATRAGGGSPGRAPSPRPEVARQIASLKEEVAILQEATRIEAGEIILLEFIAAGSEGRVYKGRWNKIECAVKMIPRMLDYEDEWGFSNAEIKAMQRIRGNRPSIFCRTLFSDRNARLRPASSCPLSALQCYDRHRAFLRRRAARLGRHRFEH